MTLQPILPAHRAPILCALMFLAFGLIAALSVPARGAEPRARDGLLLFAPDAPDNRFAAPVVAGTAEITVSGITGRATVSQDFLNPADAWVEGVYVFPLPEDAAVDTMRLRIDDRVIEGRIAERGEARRRYDAAAAGGRQASLLAQERPNMFTMSVANIPPKGRIAVEIGYQQKVSCQDGRLAIRFPMAVTPRYVPAPGGFTGASIGAPSGPPADAGRIDFPVHPFDAPDTNPMAIRVTLDPGLPLGALQSPSHELMVREPEDGRYEVTLKPGAAPADRDFVLEWTLEAPKGPKPALFVEKKGGEAYLMALIVPPASKPDAAARIPREAVFVIDTSGSMHGRSMRQARDALVAALRRLHPGDWFNVVAFNDRPTRLFGASRPVDDASLDAARSFVSTLQADGGTEIAAALAAALDGPATKGRLRQVVLLTDGAVGNEAEVLGWLRSGIGDSRLFTVAIGSAPNGFFMREAARIGRGTTLHIDDLRQVQGRMADLFRKLENPVLTDIRARFPVPDLTDALPAPVPDLYHGEPLVLTARLPLAKGDLLFDGRIAGREWSLRAALDTARPGRGIARLWAREKVAREMGRLRAGADAAEVREAVIDLAMAHGLLTKYTSLVAVDPAPARPEVARMSRRDVPANAPDGWTPPESAGRGLLQRTSTPAAAAAGAAVTTVSLGARTATPATFYAIAGVVFLFAAMVLWRLRRRRPA